MQIVDSATNELEQIGAEESDGQARIVRAAYPLFVEHGFASVSMQDIADAVPIHKATLYHHFSSKDDLFIAVVRVSMRRLHKQIEEIIANGGTGASQLAQVAAQLFIDNQSDLGQLMSDVNQYLTLQQRQALVTNCSDPWSLYERIFHSAIADGELPPLDPTLATTLFIGLIYGQTWSVRTQRIPNHLDKMRAAFLVETLFAGLRSTVGLATADHEEASAGTQG